MKNIPSTQFIFILLLLISLGYGFFSAWGVQKFHKSNFVVTDESLQSGFTKETELPYFTLPANFCIYFHFGAVITRSGGLSITNTPVLYIVSTMVSAFWATFIFYSIYGIKFLWKNQNLGRGCRGTSSSKR